MMKELSRRAQLHRKVDEELTDPQVERVHDYVDALTREIVEWVLPDSWLVSESWREEFRSRLQAHHAVNIAPLSKTTFEDAFSFACASSGNTVTRSASATNRFWDVQVGDVRLSLKTTAAKNLNPKFVHISKLTEAAWIQDQRSASGRREKTIELIRNFRENVDAIIILRAFRHASESVRRYELIEIPGALLDAVYNTPKAAFDADGPRVPLPFGETEPDLVLKLDRSDSKITLTLIRIKSCVVHAVWDFSDPSVVSRSMKVDAPRL
ncbi:MAG: hypothetical protein ACRDSH_24830 [Pseudonocardiaceae bacterium]